MTTMVQAPEDATQLILKLATYNDPELVPPTKFCTATSHVAGTQVQISAWRLAILRFVVVFLNSLKQMLA